MLRFMIYGPTRDTSTGEDYANGEIFYALWHFRVSIYISVHGDMFLLCVSLCCTTRVPPIVRLSCLLDLNDRQHTRLTWKWTDLLHLPETVSFAMNLPLALLCEPTPTSDDLTVPWTLRLSHIDFALQIGLPTTLFTSFGIGQLEDLISSYYLFDNFSKALPYTVH